MLAFSAMLGRPARRQAGNDRGLIRESSLILSRDRLDRDKILRPDDENRACCLVASCIDPSPFDPKHGHEQLERAGDFGWLGRVRSHGD